MEQIHQYYKYFYDRNIGVSMIPVDADFSKYKVVVAPVLYMVKEGMKEALSAFVKNGGVLVTTFMSGIVNESDNVHLGGYPGPLRELAGVWVEEIDALGPEQTNTITFADGTAITCNMLCDLMHLETAQCLASYDENFYAGMPAVTMNSYGSGTTYYIGTNMKDEGIAKVLDMAVEQACVAPVIDEATMLEITCRKAEHGTYYFIINFKDAEIPLPARFEGMTDLLTGEMIPVGKVMKQYDALLVRICD